MAASLRLHLLWFFSTFLDHGRTLESEKCSVLLDIVTQGNLRWCCLMSRSARCFASSAFSFGVINVVSFPISLTAPLHMFVSRDSRFPLFVPREKQQITWPIFLNRIYLCSSQTRQCTRIDAPERRQLHVGFVGYLHDKNVLSKAHYAGSPYTPGEWLPLSF